MDGGGDFNDDDVEESWRERARARAHERREGAAMR